MNSDLIKSLEDELNKALSRKGEFVKIDIIIIEKAKGISIINGLRYLRTSEFNFIFKYAGDKRRKQDKMLFKLLSESNLFTDFNKSDFGYDGVMYEKLYGEDVKSILLKFSELLELLDIEDNLGNIKIGISSSYI